MHIYMKIYQICQNINKYDMSIHLSIYLSMYIYIHVNMFIHTYIQMNRYKYIHTCIWREGVGEHRTIGICQVLLQLVRAALQHMYTVYMAYIHMYTYS